jgi:hypothetical protein
MAFRNFLAIFVLFLLYLAIFEVLHALRVSAQWSIILASSFILLTALAEVAFKFELFRKMAKFVALALVPPSAFAINDLSPNGFTDFLTFPAAACVIVAFPLLYWKAIRPKGNLAL